MGSSGSVEMSVNWTCSSSTGGSGEKVKSASEQHPVHTYEDSGQTDVMLTVTDQAGNSSALTIVGILILSRPTAAFGFGPNPGLANEEMQFTDLSSDDGSIVAWDWDFGDNASSTEQNPKHTFATTGTFNVTLVSTDNPGLQDSVPCWRRYPQSRSG